MSSRNLSILSTIAIQTQRLELISGSEDIITAEIEDREKFGRLLRANIPLSWPPETLKDALPFFRKLLIENPELGQWLLWYAIKIDCDERILCGSVKFKGAPDNEGKIEIGYSVLPEFQQKGFATEMVGGLIRWVREQNGVVRIDAQTTIDNVGSICVLKKNGFIQFENAGDQDSVWFSLVIHR